MMELPIGNNLKNKYSLSVKGYWEIGQIDICIKKDGDIIERVGIPIHISSKVRGAIQAEEERFQQMDEEYEKYCRDYEESMNKDSLATRCKEVNVSPHSQNDKKE